MAKLARSAALRNGVVMRHIKWTVFSFVVYLSLFVWTEALVISSPSIAQLTQRVSRITDAVRDVSEGLGYRATAGNLIPDKWAEARRQGELVDYAYLTLFGPDSDNSHLGINGRIGVTVLAFNNEEMAERQLAKIKVMHSGNIGFMLIREDREGYLIEEGNGLYATVIVGADLLLLEDRSRMQRKAIDTIAQAIAKKPH
jgi:hypothetical protein